MIAGLKSYPFSAYSIHPDDGPAKRLHFCSDNLIDFLAQEGEPGNLKYQPEGVGKGIGSFFRKNLLAANRIYCFWLPMISDAVFKHRGGKSKSQSKRQNQALAAKLVYQPTPATSLKDLRDEGIRKQFQVVSFQAKDGMALNGWYAPPKGGMPTILLSYGAGSSIPVHEPLMKAFLSQGYGFFAYDYRGFGKSQGTPSESGLKLDIEAASQLLEERFKTPSSEQILMGRSLGGAVSAHQATQRPYKALVLISTFTDLYQVADNLLTRFHVPKFKAGDLIREPFDVQGVIGEVRSPILFVHGDKDNMVPLAMAETLQKGAKGSPKTQLLEVQGARHSTFLLDVASEKIRTELESLLKQPRPTFC